MSKHVQPPSLVTTLAGIAMDNPVMVASGTFGYGPEYADLVDLNRLGAIVVKGICLEAWNGNNIPRMIEVRGGLINAIGLQGPGVDGFVETYMPFLRQFDTPVIVNIWGRDEAEYEEVAARFDDVDGIAGLELNISCPNVKEGGIAFGTDLTMASDLIGRVRKRTSLPLIPKLAPNVPQVGLFARAAEEAGADAISLINTLPAMVIDIETRRPVLANRVGGLSGPAIHPVAVKQVWEAAQAVSIPVIGMGGIETAADAIEFMIAGASAVAVGTANFTDPTTVVRVIDGMADYLVRHDMATVGELVGSICE
ncbi:MAG: dihydroorotate dehydrogenase [Verrucomicrobia bacterium]|jgi:dihydroorotate dehydrogenase (NAD+) catalytic subunit|nr:dihydroorotate dehydrogenase [Verrucomicrobiota bacterium]MBT7065590.1 dihydroorotate dehydrogenase [Verrucomicrobiota bacterium]MBT7700160.1 dihydroorotate dehydrogenase [Verrucomicrobiota bacterium]